MNKSSLNNMMLFITVFISLLMITLGAVWKYEADVLHENNIHIMEQTLGTCSIAMKNDIESINKILIFIMSNSLNIEQISNLNESNRYFASINFLSIAKELVTNNSAVDMILLTNNDYDVQLVVSNGRLNFDQRIRIQEVIRENNSELSKEMLWKYQTIGPDRYLTRQIYTDRYVLSAWIHIDTVIKRMTESESSLFLQYAIKDKNGEYIGVSEKEFDIRQDSYGKYEQMQVPLNFGDLSLVCKMEKGTNLLNMSLIPFVIIFILVITIILLFAYFMYMRKELYNPMNRLMNTIRQVESGNMDVRVADCCKNEEFCLLNHSFNNMMDTIVNLKIASYKRKIEFQSMELRYFQTRIRPHFFLNAMNTINSMTYQDRNEDIRNFIIALSRNIRYIFQAGLHTVTVDEETEHLKSYFEMQETLYPKCVFSFIDVNEEVRLWKIPHMILHMFIENEYKHAVSVDSLLSIFIKISAEKFAGEIMLRIVIEDDGVGFPEHVINFVNGNEIEETPDRKRIGLASVKQILYLMYGRKGLLILSNSENGGRVEIHIPKETNGNRSLLMEKKNEIDYNR